MMQPHLDMKPFLPFPMDTTPHPHSMNLFHNFNTMDPVQKAVINHTFGVPLIKTKRPVISCNVCQIRFNSESQAEAHYKGNRHARRVKGIETSKSRPQEGDKPPTVPPTSSPSPPIAPGTVLDIVPNNAGCSTGSASSEQSGSGAPVSGAGDTSSPSNPETEEDKAKKLLYCSLCKVAVNSMSQLEAHNKGGFIPIGEQGGGPVDPNTQEQTFHCEICNVRVNSELQLKQHISSRRHRDGMAGKPNPLLSRHKKHRGADLTSSLTFSKDLTKALGARLLHNPLAVAAAMAAAASSNQMALRAAAPGHLQHHHLLQGHHLSHLLRPAPGPMRTTHGPILFSPY
ncbi:Zinc finger protein 385A [Liparis tanakae]|uniref:Zinc finger protein 385A n=1 Tax=Liparis tanakae TaxID=230148 RepID=A0A4Z2GTH0_9TELE|nr:Zinc finger protein 385A [Liparis tanakae]